MTKVGKLVLVRHGESTWNALNKFTGWTDVGLNETGMKEAENAAELLKDWKFDFVYTSVLKRAIKTSWVILEGIDQLWLPTERHWRLNERHYGALQGLNKAETAEKHGEEQVHIWRRSFDVPPPSIEVSDKRHPSHEEKYRDVPVEDLPGAESLKLTAERTMPYFNKKVLPMLKEGKNILLVAHGNSIRAMVQDLDSLTPDEILKVNIPTAQPLVYEFDDNMKAVKHYYLGNQDAIEEKMKAVANQGKKS
mmetsp:Transcript_13926/g.21077  ORF Transcript_13926/g.21077 Transcript_13926/m.21077 type:complete len:250 (+) Transcript_13926:29-778(+)